MDTQWKNYIGNRVLVKYVGLGSTLTEVTVLEVTPSNKVKLRNPQGHEGWHDGNQYEFVEVLPNKPDGLKDEWPDFNKIFGDFEKSFGFVKDFGSKILIKKAGGFVKPSNPPPKPPPGDSHR